MATARRAYWKGYLKLSLVACPIALHPASGQTARTHFHQINRRTGNRLRQQMVDEQTGKVVEGEDKSRGYEIAKGKYVEIDPDEIKAIQIESTHTLDIDSFVPIEEIDRRYFDRGYYIVPDGRAGQDAFAVIRNAMKDKGRIALASIVLANREHTMAIEPFGKIMLGTVLRYDYEVRDEKELANGMSNPKVSKEMLELASHILDTKAGHFDPSRFKDEFEIELRKLVKRKAAGRSIEYAERPERPSNVIDLMEALRKSVRGERGASASSRRRRKASTKTRRRKLAGARKKVA